MAGLPEHPHAIWRLPPGDAGYPTRWSLLKAGFSRRLDKTERLRPSRAAKRERGIWQRRYWEHQSMKGITLVLAAASLSAVAADDTFGARVQRAKLVEESSEGAAYQKELWARVGDHAAAAMQRCFPRNVKVVTTVFTLVGDVDRSSQLRNVVVQPSTPMSRCFASAFSAAQFPGPPEAFRDQGMPLVIEMKITP